MAATLSSTLIPRLQARFPGQGMRVHEGARPVVTFPPLHPEIGDLTICDDGHELTLCLGNFAHGHFSPFDYSCPVEEYAGEVVEQVVAFLEDLFDDRVEFWSDGDGMGGWQAFGKPNSLGRSGVRRFVWSGPLET